MSAGELSGGFEFKALTPELALEREAHRVFEEIMNLSPYDAILDASIERRAGNFVVTIEIHSNIGRFEVLARAGDWRTALESAEARMQKELHDWKGSNIEERGPHHRMAA